MCFFLLPLPPQVHPVSGSERVGGGLSRDGLRVCDDGAGCLPEQVDVALKVTVGRGSAGALGRENALVPPVGALRCSAESGDMMCDAEIL